MNHEAGFDENELAARKNGRNPALPPNHPINALSKWRKALCLTTLAFCGLMGNFNVAIILVAFQPMAETFGVTPPDIANCLGYSFLGMAVGPIFWNPLSRTIGRRPVYLIGSALLLPCCVWLALSPSYGSFAAARVVTGFFNSWSQTVPPSTISDIYIEEVRGSKMALYVVCIVLAPCVAPIFCGLIVNAGPWRNLFWFILGLCGLQLIMCFFFVPETMFNETDPSPSVETASPTLSDDKVEATKAQNEVSHIEANHPQSTQRGYVGVAWYPWQNWGEYVSMLVSPIIMFKYIAITATSFYYGSIFAWSVGLTVILPQKYAAPPYNFALIPLGASFLAFGVGSVIGIPLGGIAGDLSMTHFAKKNGGDRQPEHRLWALFPMLPVFFASCLICGFGLERNMHWIVFLVGGGIMYVTLTAITGILQTYVLETFLPKGMDTQAVFTFWRLMWAFAIAFFAWQWGLQSGFLVEMIVQGALGAGLGVVLCVGLIWKGQALRQWQGMPQHA